MDIGDEFTHAPLAATAALEGNLQPVGVPHHGVPPIAYRDPQILGLVAVEIQHVVRRDKSHRRTCSTMAGTRRCNLCKPTCRSSMTTARVARMLNGKVMATVWSIG